MLTLILLVVLGGGAGLLAVWLIDARGLSQLFGRLELGSLRRPRRSATARPVRPTAPDTGRDARFEPLASGPTATSRMIEQDPVPVTATAAYEPVEAPLAPLPVEAPRGRRDGKRVPAAYTAVEGTYREVARVPLWRKLVSLVALLGVLVLVGLLIAAVAGAGFGLVAELVDGAVG